MSTLTFPQVDGSPLLGTWSVHQTEMEIEIYGYRCK